MLGEGVRKTSDAGGMLMGRGGGGVGGSAGRCKGA